MAARQSVEFKSVRPVSTLHSVRGITTRQRQERTGDDHRPGILRPRDLRSVVADWGIQKHMPSPRTGVDDAVSKYPRGYALGKTAGNDPLQKGLGVLSPSCGDFSEVRLQCQVLPVRRKIHFHNIAPHFTAEFVRHM